MKEETIGGFIQKVRKEQGLTQKELAERTGIRPPTISAMCTGTVKRIPVEGLDKICEVLDCQPADLMEFIPDQ